MKLREVIYIIIIFLLINSLFFYKSFQKGHLPFPGDLLVAEYKPWRSYSFLGYNPGSYPHKAQYPDTLRQLYPWKTLSLKLLKQFKLPLWNPHNFAGTPHLANFQTAVFYPLNFFYFIFNQPLAWTILVFLQPLFACFFTYLYSRKINLSLPSAIFASVSFAYGSFMTIWLEYNTIGHVILWLPLTLYSLEKIKIKYSWFAAFLLLFSLSSSALAGHPQVFIYLYIFTIIYFILRFKSSAINFRYLILFMLPLGISAIQFIPGIEFYLNSARSSHDYSTIINKILIQPWQLIMLALPDFYGNPATRTYWPGDTYIGKVTSVGLTALFFIPAIFRSKNSIKKYYISSVAIIIMLTTNNFISRFIYLFNLPLISSSSPNLMVFLLNFSMAQLAALGLDQFIAEKHTIKKLTLRSIQTLSLLLILFLIVHFLPSISPKLLAQNLFVAKKSVIYAFFLSLIILSLFFAAVARVKYFKTAIFLLLFIHILDLFISFKKFNPFSPSEFVYPQTSVITYLKNIQGIDRYWGYGTAFIEANFSTQLGIYSSEGYDPLYPRWYGELIWSAGDGQIKTKFSGQNRSDATILPGYGEMDLPTNPYRLRLLDALGVRYLLDRDENGSTLKTFPSNKYKLIYEDNGWKIFENLQSSPRIFLTSDYKVYNNKIEFIKYFFDPTFNPSQTILLEKDPEVSLVNTNSPGIVKLLSYEPNEVNISYNSESPALLYLSDVYYPGWQALVDNNLTKIIKANYAFRALEVPAGEHVVQFKYLPKSLVAGAWISIASIMIAIYWLLTQKKHEK